MTEETKKRMENARHNWRAFSTDDNGVCNEKPDDVFEAGYTAAHNDAQGEIEKLKAENAELGKLVEVLTAKVNSRTQEKYAEHSQLTLERAASAELADALKKVKIQISETNRSLATTGCIPYGGFGTSWIDDVLAAHNARQKERGE